jgi:hypothetical protein
MSRTRVGDLLAALVAVGALGYVLLRFGYSQLPALAPITPAPLAVLAVVELVLARRVRRVVGRDPDAKPMAAIAIARLVALGKASALVGAGMAGAALALVAHVAPDIGQVTVARSDAIVGALLAAAAVLLCVAGIVLERSGIVPTGGSPGAAA